MGEIIPRCNYFFYVLIIGSTVVGSQMLAVGSDRTARRVVLSGSDILKCLK